MGRQLERLGVEVRLGTHADAESVAACGLDHVIVMTGAQDFVPALVEASTAHFGLS